MEELIRVLEGLFGDYLPIVAYGFLFVATTLLAWGLMTWLMGGMTPVRRRLHDMVQPPTEVPHAPHKEGEFDVRWMEPAVRLILPTEGWRRSQLRTRLVRAGYRRPNAIHLFLALKLLLALALPFLLVTPLLLPVTWPGINKLLVVAALAASAVIGFYLPDLQVTSRIRERQRIFVEGFPDALDMLVVCVEAGLGLDAAIQRVGHEMGVTNRVIADEFGLLSLELRAGKSREEALRALGERVDVDEVRALTTMLIQAEHFGTSVGTALSEHADEMRIRRIQTAEEKAAKLPVKLILPVAVFIFPALFLVVLGPALVRIVQGFVQIFGGR
jgi:tight adherence protein C